MLGPCFRHEQVGGASQMPIREASGVWTDLMVCHFRGCPWKNKNVHRVFLDLPDFSQRLRAVRTLCRFAP